MKTLLRKFWDEPAAASAVLVAAVLAAGEAFLGDGLTASDLPSILAVLGVGGLTRPLVSPKKP
jgi:hypothetical protein